MSDKPQGPNSSVLAVRIPPEDLSLLEEIVAVIPYANRSDVARDAIHRGLRAIKAEMFGKFSKREGKNGSGSVNRR